MGIKLKGFDYGNKEIADAIKSNRLLQISVNIGSKCNYFCDYCLMSSGQPRENELANDEIKDVLKQAKELGARTWYIAGDGEPLMHKGIGELVDYANKLGMWVVMATNGELLTLGMALKYKLKGISFITKFNSLNQAIFSSMVKADAIFEEVNGMNIPRGVASLIKAGYNKGPLTRAGIETVITALNLDDIPRIYEFTQKNSLFANIEMMLPIGRAAEHPELMPSKEQIRELYVKLDSIRGNFSRFTDLSHYGEDINCHYRLRYSLYTNSTGEVYLCFSQSPEMSTGMNVRVTPLGEILERRKFPKFLGGCACSHFSRSQVQEQKISYKRK